MILVLTQRIVSAVQEGWRQQGKIHVARMDLAGLRRAVVPDCLRTLASESPLAMMVSEGSQGQVRPGHFVPHEHCPLNVPL